MEGIVKKWMMSYGFIGAEGMDKDIFVHQSDVKSGSMLKEGQKVKFDVKDEPKGPKAVNVEVIG
ncbi:MAG: cold-shock protein [Thermoplasmata archaeon]|nr:MAG: cold-shock protein [Thermoplasmata archaeon]